MLNIISNISSKSELSVGEPFCTVNGKIIKIEKDYIYIDTIGALRIELGYSYGGEKLVHFNDTVISSTMNDYYKYSVPILLSGNGKMKKISKGHFYIYKVYRRLLNSWWVLVILIVALFFII